MTVTSPAIGRVGVFQCRLGDHLDPGTPIVELLDEAQRYLIAYVPSKEIAAFGLDTEVQLRFSGEEFRTGIVTNVAPQAKPCSLSNEGQSDTTILVHIEQTGQVWPSLPMGSQVQVRLAD